jgi:hypothetical protein
MLAEEWNESHRKDVLADDRALLPRQHGEGLDVQAAARTRIR